MSALRYVSLPLLFAALLLAGCGKKFSDDSKVLATVNGEKITELNYNNYLQLRQSQQAPMADKDKERKVVLDELIDRMLLAQQGAKLDVEQNPEVYFRLKRVQENILAQEVIRKTVQEAPISDDDVKKRFQEELERTHKTEYKVRHILVKTEDEAKDVAKQLKAGTSFAQLAKTKSIDTGSGSQGGALPDWINQGSGLVPEFFNALTTMKKGQTSDPVKSEFGWHLIKVEDTRPLKVPTLEQFLADPRGPTGMRRRMQEERLQAMLKDLKDKAKISIN